MDKQQIKERQQEILGLLQAFCAQKLNEEYFSLAERLLAKLGRKRNIPFATGQPKTWAAGIIHALGTINFLFDKSIKPYVSVDEITAFFQTSKSASGNKSKEIRDMLGLRTWDREFSTRHILQNNPFKDLVMVDGLIVPLDTLPEEMQTIVRQARAQGRDVSFRTE
jgi:hypothetical protein